MSLPLEGIRMIEKSSSLAGRLAGLLFSDQGATVIVDRGRKVLEPLDGYLDRGEHIHFGSPAPD